MNDFKELKAQLKKLNGLQWTKKQQLKQVIKIQASNQRRMCRNMVTSPEGHPGARYVPLLAAQSFVRLNRKISELTKDLNQRKREINILENNIFTIKNTISKNAFFLFIGDASQRVLGIHAFGFKGPKDEFYQEEIWSNTYETLEDGTLRMVGGSHRVFSEFDMAIDDYKSDPNYVELDSEHIKLTNQIR